MTTPTVTEVELIAAARALYETEPEAKPNDIAKRLGVPATKVREWHAAAKEAGDPWRMMHKWEQDGSAKADRAAEALAPALEQTRDEAEREAKAMVSALPPASCPTLRDELMSRHRQEWIGPRSLAYQAMKLGAQKGRLEEAFTLAKLAKISAETLTLVQRGELASHGIKPGDGDGQMVVIERTGDDA